MKIQAALPVIISLILSACTQNKPSDRIPVVGEAVDSVAIANDTVQQENIEGSYEYAQTIIVSPKLAYDVRAYGGPASRGEYCIIRRGENNKPDTVVSGERHGIIVTSFTADLNKNNNAEIYLIIQSADTFLKESIIAYEFDKEQKAVSIDVSDYSKAEINTGYKGKDNISLTHQMIKRTFPSSTFSAYGKKDSCYGPGLTGCIVVADYTLKKNILILSNLAGWGPGIN